MPEIPDTCRAVYFQGDGRVVVGERELPEPDPREVVMKTAVSLISAGTETSGLIGRRNNPNPDAEPTMPGYSTAGTVVAIGDEVTDFQVGDRIIGMAGECYKHSEYNIGHPMVAVHIPDGVSFDEAVMVCLAGTSMQAVRRLDPKLGEFHAIVGQGMVGQFATTLTYLSGGRVAAIDLDQRRLDIALEHGAEIAINPAEQDVTETLIEWADGEGIDGSLLAYGGPGTDVMKQLAAAALTAPDTHQVGNMVIVGGIHAELSFPITFGNMDLKPSCRTGPGYHDPEYHMGRDYPRAYVRWTTRRNFIELLRRVHDGSFPVDHLITHHFPFEQAAEAYDTIIDSDEHSLGVILTYGA